MANICHIAFPSFLSAFYLSVLFDLTHTFKGDLKGFQSATVRISNKCRICLEKHVDRCLNAFSTVVIK